MQADNRVTRINVFDDIDGIPVVPICERDNGRNVVVMFIVVRTDYRETEVEAIKRAHRVADFLTDNK